MAILAGISFLEGVVPCLIIPLGVGGGGGGGGGYNGGSLVEFDNYESRTWGAGG